MTEYFVKWRADDSKWMEEGPFDSYEAAQKWRGQYCRVWNEDKVVQRVKDEQESNG